MVLKPLRFKFAHVYAQAPSFQLTSTRQDASAVGQFIFRHFVVSREENGPILSDDLRSKPSIRSLIAVFNGRSAAGQGFMRSFEEVNISMLR